MKVSSQLVYFFVFDCLASRLAVIEPGLDSASTLDLLHLFIVVRDSKDLSMFAVSRYVSARLC